MSRSHEEQLQEDLTLGFEKLMLEDPSLTPAEAMSRVTKDMLANNPFVPPEGCPVNDLPNELLAHIFFVGMEMEMEQDALGEDDDDVEEDEYVDELDLLKSGWANQKGGDGENQTHRRRLGSAGKAKECDEGDEEEGDEEENERRLPFQVLVSHVCRHWREVAIESPLLWTTIFFGHGNELERAKTWIERSKGHPLVIAIDCTTPDEWEEVDSEDDTSVHDQIQTGSDVHAVAGASTNDVSYEPSSSFSYLSKEQVSDILDLIIPTVDRWKSFDVTATFYDAIYVILERLSKCPSAPLLETLELYHYEDCEEYEHFDPPDLITPFLLFNGNAPNLKQIALWGVHVDWDASLSFLTGLQDLEIAYHAHDVRPSFETFKKMLSASPELHTLSLCLSGPAGSKDDWGNSPIELPSVKDLVLCHHEPAYIESLLPLLSVPNVVNLAIDYDTDDYTGLAHLLAQPFPGRTKSLLAGLEHLKIGGLPSNRKARELMLEQLVNLKSIHLNCSGDEEEFFERLSELKQKPSEAGTAQSVAYCPHLTGITTTGIDGKAMKKFVEVRKQGGAPLSRVSMSEDDDLDTKDEAWLKDHLEELDFFEPSDSEEDMVEIGEDDSEDEDNALGEL